MLSAQLCYPAWFSVNGHNQIGLGILTMKAGPEMDQVVKYGDYPSHGLGLPHENQI